MPSEAYAALFALMGLAIGAVATYWQQRRATSGQVATSSADKLWESYSKLLDAYVNENGRLRDEVRSLQNRAFDLEQRAHQSELKEQDCDQRNIRLTAEVSKLQNQMESLRQQMVETAAVTIDHEREGR